MLRASEIRAQYPVPRSGRQPGYRLVGQDAYCVGGAVCFLVAKKPIGFGYNGFPGQSSIARALMLGNWRLPIKEALHMADMIVEANDQCDFEEAWQIVDLALTYGAPVDSVEMAEEPELVGESN